MNEVERLEEKMKSKNWKERQEAYIQLGNIINKDTSYALIPFIQNETNIPALESGIDAILKAERAPTVGDVAKIFGHIGNIKTTVRAKVFSLIDFIAREHTDDVVGEMVSLVNSKTPKTVCGAVSALVEIAGKFKMNVNFVGSCLKQVFGHADKSVRAEGTKLCVVLYKKYGEEIRKYIKDVKPIQLKELEEEFAKIHPEEKIGEVAKKEKEAPAKSLKKCGDEKWNIRLEGLSELKACIPFPINSDTLSVLYSRINDPNNQVFFEVLEILSLIKLKNQRIMNGLVERLKDKKVIVCEKIKDSLLKMDLPEEFLQKEYFTHKNPQVKINIIDYVLKKGVKRKEINEWIQKCTKDQNAQVRNKAIEYLEKQNEFNNNINNNNSSNNINNNNINNNKIDNKIDNNINNNKIDNNINNNKINNNINNNININNSILLETKRINSTTRNTITPIKRAKVQSSSYFGPTQEEKEGVLESFYLKYPFFREKMWNIRLEAIRENIPLLLSEEIRDLMVFFYTHKENIFQVNLAQLDLLIQRKEELEAVRNTLLLYCTEKITENKLQIKIVEVLRLINQKECLSFLKNEIKDLKQGKKFVSMVWLVGELISKKNCDIEEILSKSVTGINEKKAIEQLKKKYEEMKLNGEEEVSKEVSKEEGMIKEVSINNDNNNNFNNNNNININNDNINNNNNNFNSPEIQTQSEEKQTFLKILKINKRHPGDKEEDVFTPEFIRYLKDKDFNTVVELLNTTNRIMISDFIIKYYVEKGLASSYFNSLILFFISEKYILQEAECVILLDYLLKNNMKEELKMMDRIYPVTKLFFVLQKIGTDEAVNEVLRLIDSYKMFRGDKKKFIEKLKKTNKLGLKKAVRECPDFLSFIDEIDGQFLSERSHENTPIRKVKKGSNSLFAPSVLEDPFGVGECPIESSLHSLSINSSKSGFPTPNLNKFNNDRNDKNGINNDFRNNKNSMNDKMDSINNDFRNNNSRNNNINNNNINNNNINNNIFINKLNSPIARRNSVDTLEDILDNLIDSNQEKSEKAFLRLSLLVDDNMPSLLFSANSIISSISIQLLDVLHRPLFATLILNVLLKLSKSQLFCEELRVETLESVNSDLITMFDSLNNDRTPSKDHIQLVLDIITNLSLNCKPLMAIQVYLNLFSKGGNRDVHLRLIWRHSKCLNKLTLEEIERMIDVFEKFYTKHVYSPLMENRTTFKMLILHIGQIVLKYSKEVEKLNSKGYTKILINLYKTKSSIRIEDLRNKNV